MAHLERLPEFIGSQDMRGVHPMAKRIGQTQPDVLMRWISIAAHTLC